MPQSGPRFTFAACLAGGTVFGMAQHLESLTKRHQAAALASAVGVSAAAAALLPTGGTMAVVAAAVLLCGRRPASGDPPDHALRRHLAICRRREERAFVLVAGVAGRRQAMTADLRISDSAVAESSRRGSTLVAVVDAHELAQARITERLRARHGEALHIGWAAFPDDGMTLDMLVAVAGSRADGIAAAEPPALVESGPAAGERP